MLEQAVEALDAVGFGHCEAEAEPARLAAVERIARRDAHPAFLEDSLEKLPLALERV